MLNRTENILANREGDMMLLSERLISDILERGKSLASARIVPEDIAEKQPHWEPTVKADQVKVEQLKNRWKKEKDQNPMKKRESEMAQCLEYIIYTGINAEEGKNGWLGRNTVSSLTSEYDDFINKIDIIVEKTDESHDYLGLGIDATYGNADRLTEKISEIKDGLTKGKLGEIKYFINREGSFYGSIDLVPKVVVGTNVENLIHLMKIFRSEKSQELIPEHPIQLEILNQILSQLVKYCEYLEKMEKADKGKETLGLLKPRMILQKKIDYISRVIKAKKMILERTKEKFPDYRGDTKLEQIKEVLTRFESL